MPEDPADDERIGDRGDAISPSAAAWAAEDILGEGALQELGPGAAVGGGGAAGWGVAFGPRHDAIAERGGGSEGTVVRPAVLAGMGDEGGQALEKGQGVEDEGTGAVAPGLAESPLDLAVAANLEATLGKGGAGDVPDEGLEALGIGGFDPRGGVEREALAVGGQAVGVRESLGGWAEIGGGIAEARGGAAGAGSEGDSILDGGGVEEREQRGGGVLGIIRSRTVGWLTILGADEVGAAGSMQGAVDAADGIPVDAEELVGLEFRGQEEGRLTRRTRGEMNAVQEEGVEVNVEGKGGPEALDEVDGAGDEAGARSVLAALAPDGACAATIGRADGTEECARDLAEKGGIAGQREAQVPRQAQDPLADRHRREYALGEVSGDLVHPTAAAGGAEAAALAGEGDQEVGLASAALEADEAEGGVAAAEERAELVLDMAGESAAAVLVPETREEGGEVGPDEMVKGRRGEVAAEGSGEECRLAGGGRLRESRGGRSRGR